MTGTEKIKSIKLNAPGRDGGLSIMKSLSLRQSSKDTSRWLEKDLSLQDLSNLLWAGIGINREDGKRTAASVMNSQDIDIYVFRKDGVYIYNAANNSLIQRQAETTGLKSAWAARNQLALQGPPDVKGHLSIIRSNFYLFPKMTDSRRGQLN